MTDETRKELRRTARVLRLMEAKALLDSPGCEGDEYELVARGIRQAEYVERRAMAGGAE